MLLVHPSLDTNFTVSDVSEDLKTTVTGGDGTDLL